MRRAGCLKARRSRRGQRDPVPWTRSDRPPGYGRPPMNRRHFLGASTAAAVLASATSAAAGPSGRRKVIVPAMEPEALADLKAAASGLDLVECRSQAEAIA